MMEFCNDYANNFLDSRCNRWTMIFKFLPSEGIACDVLILSFVHINSSAISGFHAELFTVLCLLQNDVKSCE